MAHPFESSRTPKEFVRSRLESKSEPSLPFLFPVRRGRKREGNGARPASGWRCSGADLLEHFRRYKTFADELFASSTLLGWGEGYTPSSVRLGTEMLKRSNKPSRRVGSSSPGTEGSNL